MAAHSTMLALGTPIPQFSLPDTTAPRTIELASTRQAPATVVAFICNHCPYVVHIAEQFSALMNAAQERGVRVIAVSSNDVRTHPSDAPEHMTSFAARYHFAFPYCYDESQNAARVFQAACTPDLYIFDGNGLLAYRGRFDDSTPGNGRPCTGAEFSSALETILGGGSVPESQQHPSIGCGIKWKNLE